MQLEDLTSSLISSLLLELRRFTKEGTRQSSTITLLCWDDQQAILVRINIAPNCTRKNKYCVSEVINRKLNNEKENEGECNAYLQLGCIVP